MLQPEDIDFAVSDTYAKGLNEQHGWDLNMDWEYPDQQWWIDLQDKWKESK